MAESLISRALLVEPEGFDVEACLRTFAEEGYARLGAVLAPEGVAALGTRLDELMLGQVEYPGMFFQHDSETGRYEDLTFGRGWVGPSLAYRKLEKLELDPLFRAWIENPLFLRIARAHIGGALAIYRAVVFSKRGGGGTALPWHQDGGRFWGVDRAPTLQIWTALDDAGVDAGCLELMPRTHQGGLATPEGGVIPDALVAAQPPGVLLAARAGEAILVHNHSWHRSGINRSAQRRAALSICYMSAETRCLRRRRSPRQFHRVGPGG